MDLEDKPLPIKPFMSLFKEYGLYSGGLFWSTLINFGVISNVDRGLYGFTNPKVPVHKKLVFNLIKEFLHKRETYYNREKKKREREKGPDPKVQAAVSLLKSLGFDIYAPVGNYYEKL